MSTVTIQQFAPKDYKSDLKPIWCPGCGDFGVLSALFKAMSSRGLDPVKTVVVSGIGCSSRLPGFVATYGFHTVHGRALTIATGIKAARPDLNVIAVGGDGDGYSIGAGHLPHCARRNPDITYLVMNNNTYGLTKGQVSPTSMLPRASQDIKLDSKRWKTTPYGMVDEAINPIAQAIAYDISFVARGFSYKPNQLADILTEAIKHKGFALVDAFSPCPTFNQEQTEAYYKDNTVDVSEDHDPTDRAKAFALAIRDDAFPVGVIYRRDDKPSLLEEQAWLREHLGKADHTATLKSLVSRFSTSTA
ncbi:MAG TPA: 2-oxoacid:ferredoxin oxidoreductase subunit beta [Capsulimonadaceae bacterium]|nr:2-oxoacid:ferredoxin oxidoreductase subunit beta [Capsulimonadaceae bacterium]